MGCACKDKQRRIMNLIPEVKKDNFEKKGKMFYVNYIINIFLNILMLFVSIGMIFMFGPIVIFYNIFIGKRLVIKIDKKLINKFKKLDYE